MTRRRILILGVGQLAMGLVQTLPAAVKAAGNASVDILVAGRDEQKAKWATVCGNAAAECVDVPIVFSHAVVDWRNEASLQAVLARAQADMIVLAASLQSVSMIDPNSAWGQLISGHGYGVTAPLQACLLSKLQRSLKIAKQQPFVVNACLPDIVNCWSMAAGERVDIGLGNVSFLAEVLRQRLGLKNEDDLFVFAGHWDIAETYRFERSKRHPFRIWRCTELLDVNATRAIGVLPPDSWLSPLAAIINARLLAAILSGASAWSGHAPGVNGQLGGVPITIEDGRPLLRLPQGMSPQVAAQYLSENISVDGIERLEGARLHFTTEAAAALSQLSSSLGPTIEFSAVEDYAQELSRVRQHYG